MPNENKMNVGGWCEGCGGPVISPESVSDENGCLTCAACLERYAEDEKFAPREWSPDEESGS